MAVEKMHKPVTKLTGQHRKGMLINNVASSQL